MAIAGLATNEDVDNPYTVDLLSTASDVDGDSLTVENVIVSSSNDDRTVVETELSSEGVLSLDPNQFNDLAVEERETITVEYKISDGNPGSAYNTATFVVEGRNDLPVASAIAGETTNEDVEDPYTLDLLDTANVSDVDDSDVLSVKNVTATSDNGDRTVDVVVEEGVLSLDPKQFNDLAEGENKDVAVNYEITDGTETIANTATFVVKGRNDLPVASAIADLTIDEDAEYPFTLDLLSTASDVDGDELSVKKITATSDHDDRTIDFYIDSTGEFLLYPSQFNDLAADERETVTVSYDIGDENGGITSNTATIVVDGRNDAPVAEAITDLTTDEDAAIFGVDLLSEDNVTDVDGDKLTVKNVTATSDNGDRTVAINVRAGILSLNPNQFKDLAYGESETVTVNYEITDGTETIANTATFTVEGMNDAPVVRAIAGETTNEDTQNPYTLNLLSTASDAEGDSLSVSATTVASSNRERTVVTAVNAGVLSLDPSQFNNLAAGESETVTVSYNVNDGKGGVTSNKATFTVEGVNDAPKLTQEIPDQIARDTDSFSLDVSGNFSDADKSDQLKFSAAGLPQGLSISQQGLISGQTSANGVYAVTIAAQDLSKSAVDKFRLTMYQLVQGNSNSESLIGNEKINEIIGLAGNDTITGLGASDRLFGGNNDDVLNGGNQNDLVSGGSGHDQLFGGYGDDLLSGGNHNDSLSGGVGNDQLSGGSGDDQLVGAAGNDLLTGGANADVFILQSNSGLDTITDFSFSEDQLQLAPGFQGSLGLTQSAGNTTISIVGEGGMALALLQGVTDVTLEDLGLPVN